MGRGLRRALMLCAVALSAVGPARASDSRVPQPVIEPARPGTKCIADPATMRREHPAMLLHQRDLTVHGGIRGAKASLKACIACHASPTTGSVAQSETNFCISCHSYTAVRIDCFGCHATRPPPTAFHPLVPSGTHVASTVRLAEQLKAMSGSGMLDRASAATAVSQLP